MGLDSPPHLIPEPSLVIFALRGVARFDLLPEKKAPQPVPRGVMQNYPRAAPRFNKAKEPECTSLSHCCGNAKVAVSG